MGVPFFITFLLSIVFLSVGVTGLGDFASMAWSPRLRFSVAADFVAELNGGALSERLRGEFKKHYFPLSKSPTMSLGEAKDGWWVITDEDGGRTYTLSQEDGVLNVYHGSLPHFEMVGDYIAILRCASGFALFLVSLYLMCFFLYLEERESGRMMKNVKSFVKLREFFEAHENGKARKQ